LSSQDIRFLASCIADPIRSFAFRFGLYACPNLTVRANGGEGDPPPRLPWGTSRATLRAREAEGIYSKSLIGEGFGDRPQRLENLGRLIFGQVQALQVSTVSLDVEP
jgi:hypothetical protein